MYVITDQLKEDGFSTHRLDYIFKRNSGNKTLNTLEYYFIYIILENVQMNVENKIFDIEAGHMVFVGPRKNIEFITAMAIIFLPLLFLQVFTSSRSRTAYF
jgi:AraC family transcriptional activator of pobA